MEGNVKLVSERKRREEKGRERMGLTMGEKETYVSSESVIVKLFGSPITEPYFLK